MVDVIAEDTYSPRYTDQVFGHETSERLFLEAFNSDRLHHAWLISGPKGVGKASLAWKFTKFLLCQKTSPDDTGLFGEDVAAEVTSLESAADSPDVQRIKSGGHGGLIVAERSLNEKTGKMRADIVIDDVRKIISFFSQTSSEGGWRIAIIDAVDELNVNAANALLKILEEPPEKSIIFLIAHSPGKLLPTISSRCRTLKLQGLPTESVKAVLAGRYPQMDMGDLITCANLAEGAPGRAIEIATHDGTTLYSTMLRLLADVPRLNIPAVHTFATELSAVKADAKYRLFIQLYLDWIQSLIRLQASNQLSRPFTDKEIEQMTKISCLAGVDHWLDLWEKMGHLVIRADAVNLDRKQIIVTLFTSLAALTRST